MAIFQLVILYASRPPVSWRIYAASGHLPGTIGLAPSCGEKLGYVIHELGVCIVLFEGPAS